MANNSKPSNPKMLQLADQTQGNKDVTENSEIIDWIFNSGIDATASFPPPPPPPSRGSTSSSGINATPTNPLPSFGPIRIPKVPRMMGEKNDYGKYYVPKVVSIGPYHFTNADLKPVQNLKPHFTMKLLLKNKEALTGLYFKLRQQKMVQELRNFYEENSTVDFSDMEFAKMMLLDACFILYYIQYVFGKKPEACPELKIRQIKLAHQDLLLLENQIPYKVLLVVAQLIPNIDSLPRLVEPFIYDSSIVTPVWPKMKLFRVNRVEFDACYHLLHVLHYSLDKKKAELDCDYEDNFPIGDWCSFRNASELADAGIDFKPSDSTLLSSVKFSRGRWLKFLANVKLPRTKVNGSTKHMLLNLIAFESFLCDNRDAWVTSYVCLLDSLIDHPADVKILRKAWVLETSLGNDKEVANLFNTIASDLVPNKMAYLETKYQIQMHYVSGRNELFSQLKNEYFRSPWAVFVLLGALLALLLSAIQTYLSLTGECDKLCNALKKNYHL